MTCALKTVSFPSLSYVAGDSLSFLLIMGPLLSKLRKRRAFSAQRISPRWNLSFTNLSSFGLIPSYPARFVVPGSVSDESLARVVVDLSGRACLVYDASAPTMFIRDFNLVLVKEFSRAFSNALGCNLHVKLEYGEEPHHVAEAIFKALARALDVATQLDPRTAGVLPSTKGLL